MSLLWSALTFVLFSFECRLFFARLSFDRRSTVVRPSIFGGWKREGKFERALSETEKKGKCRKLRFSALFYANICIVQKKAVLLCASLG